MKLPALLARLRGGARQPKPEPEARTTAAAAKRRTGLGLAGLFAGNNDILVLAEDATGLTAVVARKGKDGMIVLGEAVEAVLSENPSGADQDIHPKADLLASVLQRLQEHGEHIPRRAAVVSAAGLATLADLPVDPAKPKPPLQMLEMVRYELEPSIANHNGLWTLGEVLAARGVLQQESRRAVAAGMAGARSGPADGNLRFGETAIALGLASRPDIDTALRVQQDLQILDNEIACGWRGYSARTPDGHAAPHWLTAGLSAACRQEWLSALAENNLRPLGFWPRAGLAGVHGSAKGHLVLALEIWPEQVIRLRLAEGHLAGLASELRLEQPVTAEWLADQLTEWLAEPLDQVNLMVADGHTDALQLATALQPLLRCPVTVAAASPLAMAQLVWQATALEALSGAPAFVAIAAGDPRAPLWQRPGARGGLVAATVALALLSWEGHAWWRIQAMQQERAALAKKLEAGSSSAAESQTLVQEAKALDLKANALRGELATALARADMLELLERRTADVPALIRALGQAIDPVVVLESIHESTETDPHIGIEVRAWSPDNGAAQAYAAAVQALVVENGLTVALSGMRNRPGRQRDNGFEVSFWLVPAADLDQEALAAEPTVAPVAPNSKAAGEKP
jgi:hypothetical protein